MFSPPLLTISRSSNAKEVEEPPPFQRRPRHNKNGAAMAVFRHSMASQYSSTSGSSHSHRYSVASTDSYTDTTTRRWSGETSHSVVVDHVPSQRKPISCNVNRCMIT